MDYISVQNVTFQYESQDDSDTVSKKQVLNDISLTIKKGEFVALECNMRAPGGYTVDLIDYANSTSVYQIYADIICFNENRQYMGYPKHYSLAVHRRDEYQYVHSDEEVLEKFADSIKMHGRYPDHIAAVMGNRYFFAVFDDFEKGMEFDKFVRLKK